MKHGYLRVSTPAQSYDQQERELRNYGVKHFDKESVSGRKAKRPVLEGLLDELRKDDELHVTKLDRLGRSVQELHEIASRLEEKGVALVIGGARHDPKDPMGKMFFGMLSVFAEFEADLIASRTRDRLATLRAQGKHVGKKRKLTERQDIAIFNAVRGNAISMKALAERYGVSVTTIRRSLEREDLKRKLKSDPALRREVRELQHAEEALLEAIEKEAPETVKES